MGGQLADRAVFEEEGGREGTVEFAFQAAGEVDGAEGVQAEGEELFVVADVLRGTVQGLGEETAYEGGDVGRPGRAGRPPNDRLGVGRCGAGRGGAGRGGVGVRGKGRRGCGAHARHQHVRRVQAERRVKACQGGPCGHGGERECVCVGGAVCVGGPV